MQKDKARGGRRHETNTKPWMEEGGVAKRKGVKHALVSKAKETPGERDIKKGECKGE